MESRWITIQGKARKDRSKRLKSGKHERHEKLGLPMVQAVAGRERALLPVSRGDLYQTAESPFYH